MYLKSIQHYLYYTTCCLDASIIFLPNIISAKPKTKQKENCITASSYINSRTGGIFKDFPKALLWSKVCISVYYLGRKG